MNKLTTVLVIMLVSLTTIAQNGINYKAIIKDHTGTIVANDLIQVQFTILQSAAQNNVYEESHTPTTDANGLIMLNIGQGTVVSGNFTSIDWSSDTHFLNVQINTGAGLVDLGTTAFNTVPYAMHAGTATTALNAGAINLDGLSDAKTDPNGSSLFLGTDAGTSDDGSNNDNVGVGYQALQANTSGSNNTASGVEALHANTTGVGNTANGYGALFSNTTGMDNTATGGQSLFFNTTGAFNSAYGTQAQLSNTTGSYNTSYGAFTLSNNTTGNNNTANGYQALASNTTGNNNTAVGLNAFANNETGSGNVALGYEAGANEIGSNKLYIANSNTNNPLVYGEFDTQKLTINGTLGLNTNTMIGSADITFRSQNDSFGGMYIDSPNTNNNGRPFYGYSLDGNISAYHYYDAADDTWKMVMNSVNTGYVEALKLTDAGDLTIANNLDVGGDIMVNTNAKIGFEDFTLKSSNNFWGGMYIDSPDSTSGKPFYGYATEGINKAFHYYDQADGRWKLNVNDANVLSIDENALNINGSISVSNKVGVQPEGTIYYNGAHFYGVTNGGVIIQLDNTTNAQGLGPNTAQSHLEIQALTEANTVLTNKVSELETRLAQLELLISEQE